MNRRRAYFDHIINYNGVKSYPLYKKLSRRRETARCSVPYDYITTDELDVGTIFLTNPTRPTSEVTKPDPTQN